MRAFVEDPHMMKASRTKGRMRALVVDPDSVFRAGVAELFESCGWVVSACNDLPAALAALAASAFDVVWTEWDLHGTAATPLLVRARARLPEAKLVIVIASSSNDLDAARAAAVDLGAYLHDKRSGSRLAAATILALEHVRPNP